MLKAGASEVVITPETSQFLFGYPHVERYSTGVHDDLYSAALFLDDGKTQVMFISNDLIFVDKQMSMEIRREISQKTEIPALNIMITSTHTHSGPIMANYASNLKDPIVPKADTAYLDFVKEKMISAAVSAYQKADEAVLGMTKADSTGIGTNRRDPAGPSDHEVPVLAVMDKDRSKYIACMMVGSMHPTVLHEDSTLLSGDFPGMAKKYLKKHVMGKDCVMLYHSGPCGNQSPRHVVNGNTFAEAERLGVILGKAVEKAAVSVIFPENPVLAAENLFVPDLPRKIFPEIVNAERRLKDLQERMMQMVENNAPHPEVRTLECDIFGAEETLTLSELSEKGGLEYYYQKSLPAEIQLIAVGPWKFIGWSGEIFVEYGLAIKRQFDNTFVITLANGEFQGYIVTPEAAEEGGYEASNSLFTPAAGELLVRKTEKLLKAYQD
ncbi:MAG: neutral/alkaline non-lysosomal ceramidase N-terminal domain-containing protein [Spirochaetales bacterium]|nr:neutral/alkaline non-lysosomal ceramidase N-terminal domain-containing protein [Spirochaetales bacterium]